MDRHDVNPDSIRSPYPQSWPQWPFDPQEVPTPREASLPTYAIRTEPNQRVRMRDGVELALDVHRPAGRPGQAFPALVGFSPYTRQLQRTDVPLGQNEGGVLEFWVPRGFAMVFVDVRGSNDSGGAWDMFGPEERADFAEVIEWIAAQPWCSGRVGMSGASYYGRTQLMAAEEQPPSLRAIFAYDAATDAYRDTFFHGGIPNEGMQRGWFTAVRGLNGAGGRAPDGGRAIEEMQAIVNGGEADFDGSFYRQRSSWPWLADIDVPVYFGCHWSFVNLHLRGAFEGWMGTEGIDKRMLVGPTPQPRKPVGEYHLEMLRWYDAWLKDLDTGVMDGPPIQLWIPGRGHWRSEEAWPLEGTEWSALHLGSGPGGEGVLDWSPGPEASRSYETSPEDPGWLRGEPRLRYRSAPFDEETEVTGPLQLDLWLASTAIDTDVFVKVLEEGQAGERLLTRGWLRASHRAVDRERSRQHRPWHPHTVEAQAWLVPDRPELLEIEVIPTANVFAPGSRLVVEIASSDSLPDNAPWYHRAQARRAVNTVLEGGERSSCLRVPIVRR